VEFYPLSRIGDVIVFGSCFSPKKDKEFVIDTVFVVDEKEKYSPKDASKLGNKVPDWYYHLTLNLIVAVLIINF
jgi:hypothetical protein